MNTSTEHKGQPDEDASTTEELFICPEGHWVCLKCGNLNEEEDPFCQKCGSMPWCDYCETTGEVV